MEKTEGGRKEKENGGEKKREDEFRDRSDVVGESGFSNTFY